MNAIAVWCDRMKPVSDARGLVSVNRVGASCCVSRMFIHLIILFSASAGCALGQSAGTLTGTGSMTTARSRHITLSFFVNSGNPPSVPLSLPQTGATTATSALTNTPGAGAMLLVGTRAQDGLAVAEWSTQLTTTGNIGGFEIFRSTTFSQEASVPLETRTPNSFVLVFDDTDGLATGVALANVANSPANVVVNVRDDTGALLQIGRSIWRHRGTRLSCWRRPLRVRPTFGGWWNSGSDGREDQRDRTSRLSRRNCDDNSGTH
jgi:hypothetical protein